MRKFVRGVLLNPITITYLGLLAGTVGLRKYEESVASKIVATAFPDDPGFGWEKDYRFFTAFDRDRDGEIDRIVFNTGRLPDPLNPLPFRERYDEGSSEFERLRENMSGNDFLVSSKRFNVHHRKNS